MLSPVTVVGGAGRTGELVVRRLLSAGAEARVASRSASHARELVAAGAKAFTVDVRDGSGLAEALAGARAVVYSVEPGTDNSGPNRPETTMYQGVRRVLELCPPDLHRFVLISSIYVTHPEHQFNEWGRLLDWRLRGEDAVRASGLPYTVIRPSWLIQRHGKGKAAVRLEQGDQGDGQITRDDVAEACVQAIELPQAVGLTFEMYNDSGTAPDGWGPLFDALAKDDVLTH
ncbi:SDR family oxidoreductase [Kutzneria sp. NPDC051319]|uniref:SDR family oxidoreductase n=1 Tax=Kutzneria sp. NPDC051319 TaxID=3155047 RepID=UPI003413588A